MRVLRNIGCKTGLPGRRVFCGDHAVVAMFVGSTGL